MDIFDILTMIGGLSLFLFGMNLMGESLERAAGNSLRSLLGKLTSNRMVGFLTGLAVTAVIQSSSASVGILQALSATGAVSYAAAIPIIMGQNIGTCVTAMLSSVGATKNAKRAAYVHLLFNIIGTLLGLALFLAVSMIWKPVILADGATHLGISICHTAFNILCTAALLPSGNLLEKLVCRLVPDAKQPEVTSELDERLLATPPIALERCHVLTGEMALCAQNVFRSSAKAFGELTPDVSKAVRDGEEKTDHYEDMLGSYLVKLSALPISAQDSAEAAMLLKALNDFERIGDHSLNILEAAEELQQKELSFSKAAWHELRVLMAAVDENISLSFAAFRNNDLEAAYRVEPLEQVIDDLKEKLRIHHILRLQQGACSIETGFVWSDLLTALERIGDHCSNIAGCIVDMAHHDMNMHEALRSARVENEHFTEQYKDYAAKYSLKR